MVTDYVVCMTSHPARKNNLPSVVKSLLEQSIPPQRIYLTLYEGDLPAMRDIVTALPNTIVRTEMQDTKVWKKFLPVADNLSAGTLIMTADDDYLYPSGCAINLLAARDYYGDLVPLVAGNDVWRYGYKCHCGGCSLVVPEAFLGWRDYARYWEQLPSDDMFYTLLAAKNGYRYTGTAFDWEHEYGGKYNAVQPYSRPGMVAETYKRTIKLFGWI